MEKRGGEGGEKSVEQQILGRGGKKTRIKIIDERSRKKTKRFNQLKKKKEQKGERKKRPHIIT